MQETGENKLEALKTLAHLASMVFSPRVLMLSEKITRWHESLGEMKKRGSHELATAKMKILLKVALVLIKDVP